MQRIPVTVEEKWRCVSTPVALVLTGSLFFTIVRADFGFNEQALAAGDHRTQKTSARRAAQAPQPIIASLIPTRYEFEIPHPAQSGSSYPKTVPLQVRGKGFHRGATIFLDGVPLQTTFVSTAILQGAIPFAAIQEISGRAGGTSPDSFSGTARVTVRNPGTHARVSHAAPFFVRATPIG